MKALAVFTNRGKNRLIADKGSQAWVLKPENALKVRYVVCFQNRDDGDWGEPTHDQGQGFLIGKISNVEPSPEGREGRYIIRFDEYADIAPKKKAHQWRNPVRYIDLEEFGIDPDKLAWHRVPDTSAGPVGEQKEGVGVPRARAIALDMTGAKKALSAFYNVPISAIEITIRG